MANTVSASANRPQIWVKKLFADVMDNMYFTANGLMGKGTNNVIQIMDELAKDKGSQINIPLSSKLSGGGVTGDSELEGNEEAISAYSDAVVIDQIRNAVRLTGLLDEQKNSYNMRMDAKDKLAIWLQEFIERQIFLKLAGVNNTILTDVNGAVVGTNALWSNTPVQVPDADTAAGYGARYLCADYTNGADSLAATDLLTPDLISRAKRKAQLASPKVVPLKIGGRNKYIMFIHPWQAYDLKNNAVWAQAQREAGPRGTDNPIFTAALGEWDDVVIMEHEYVPYLNAATTTMMAFAAATDQGSTTQFTNGVGAFRALLCGRQAAVFAKTKDSDKGAWVEKKFDYDNKTGFKTGFIGGIQKITHNSKDYGVIAVDTSGTALV